MTSAAPPKKYTGTHPPNQYDPAWRTYGPGSGITAADVVAFKAMPETMMQVARDLRHAAVIKELPNNKTITSGMTSDEVGAALEVAKTNVAKHYATEATVLAGIGKTIHNQDDVIAAFKAVG